MKKIIILITLLQVSPLLWRGAGVYAQDQTQIDSLQLQLKKHYVYKLELGKNVPTLFDTTAANILADISYNYWYENYDKALDYARQCLVISEKLDYKKGLAKAYNGMGVINLYKGDYPAAHDFLNKALRIREEIKDSSGVGATLNNIGAVYYSQAIYTEALKYYLAALKVNEQLGNKILQADNIGNIGGVYRDMAKYDEALTWLFRALKIREDLNIKDAIVISRADIGELYLQMGNYSEALKQFNMGLELNKAETKSGLNATLFLFIGKTFFKQGNYPEALKNLFECMQISEALGEKTGIADCYNYIGAIYTKQKKYAAAAEYLNNGLIKSKEIGALDRIRDSYQNLAELESAQGHYDLALAQYKLFITYHDSLNNNEIANKTAALQFQYNMEKKEQQIALLNTDKKIQEKEISKKKTERNGFVAGCILLLMIGGVTYNRYQVKQKTNKELSDALTQLKQAQQKLVEQEKLASLGQLTAGIAHEIQNPLNFVINFSQLSNELFDDLNKEGDLKIRKEIISDLEDNISKIEKHGLRADGIIQSMLMHSKSGKTQRQLTNLNALCKEALALALQSAAMSNPDFTCRQHVYLDEHLPKVNIVSQNILNVIINLLSNSFYAMNEKKYNSNVAEKYEPEINIQSFYIDGNVHLKVTDNGNGIAPEIKKKIFQPFFTTKPTHLGVGLGLSISYDVLKAHGGNLAVESSSPNGTVFVLSLPV
jgi:signal transduction histidine kinase